MKAYKAVFLDWDNTIGDFNRAAFLAIQNCFEHYHLERFFASLDDYLALYGAHNLQLWKEYGQDKVTKEFLKFDRFAFPLREVGVTETQVVPLAQAIGDDFCRLTTEYFTVMPDAEPVVRYLKQRYPLTIVSNGFVEVQYEKIQRSGLQDCFEHVVLSEEVGIQKPNPLIYLKACALNGVKPEEAVMIGDSYYSDIAGAQAAGIDQIWVLHDPSERHEGETATWIVSDLKAVYELL